MILVIRISGMVKVPVKIQEALFRIRLRRKYSAVLMEDNKESKKLLKKVRDYVAFGTVSDNILEKLVKLRGGGKSKKEIKFFRLHPPRGGIESKKHFGVGKGVLGDNKDKINKLVERML